MCGISGIIKIAKPITSAEIEAIAQIQRHRGPDHTGVWQAPGIALIHNRLSLLDLSESGNQPFFDDNYVLVFNGEIYNWKKIRQDLEQIGIQFHSQSDTEVLFHALKKWGVRQTIPKLKGMFAFAWYDIVAQKCTLVRDRLGIKPLFYEQVNGEFWFASEVKALVKEKGFNDLNMQFVAQSYYGVYETQPHSSPFKQIRQLEPGCLLEVSLENLTVKQETWFTLADWVDEQQYQILDKMSSAEVEALFSDLFKASVASMAVSDAPMGAFVSGGIDSSVIASTAKEFSELQLFTANVIGKFSEFESAKLLANSLGVPLNSYDYQPDFFMRDVEKCTWHYDGPISLFTNSVAFSGVAQMAREKGVKAVLTGEGADELFLGYPKLLTRRFDKLVASPIHLLNKMYAVIPGLSEFVGLNAVDLQKQVLQGHMNGYREEYKDAQVMKSFDFLDKNSEGYRCASITVNQIHRHLHSLLWRNDRMGMMYSIESRFPFLDEDIVKFALNLPHRYKIGRTKKMYNWKHPFLLDKAIVRNFANRTLPKELVYKKKFGFGVTAHYSDQLPYNFEFFKGGFWQQVCDMDDNRLAFTLSRTPKKLLNKIAAVEIWGKQFVK
jgi:asparagine synthase (glutamine-hydrolysing)